MCFILVFENLRNSSMIHKNGMDCSCAGFGVGLLSVHLYSGVFSGPSKTMDSTQFHVLFLYSAILPPEPKLEYRIGENILVPLFLNEITFCQHTLVACDGLCTAQFIFPHYGDGVEAVFTIARSMAVWAAVRFSVSFMNIGMLVSISWWVRISIISSVTFSDVPLQMK